MSAPVGVVLVLLALAAVVVLWKVIATATGIAGVQWAIVANVDSAAVQVVTFALPALLIAFVLTRGLPRLGGSMLGRGGRGHKVVTG